MMIPRKSAKKMAKNWSKRPKICKKIKLTSMTIPRKSVQKSVKNLNVSAKINLSKNWSKIGRKSAKKLRRSFEKRCYRKKEIIYIYPKLSLKIGSVNKAFLFWHWLLPKSYCFRNKTFLFYKIESWNFQHLLEKEFLETSQNYNSIRQLIE